MEPTGTLLTMLTTLVAVPLTASLFYVRSLRENQLAWQGEMTRRVEAVEVAATDLRRFLAEFGRDYATKEEWLRECMQTRRTVERLSEVTARIESILEAFVGLPAAPAGIAERAIGSAGYRGRRAVRGDDTEEDHA